MAPFPRGALWATALVGFGLLSLPIANGSARPFSVETGIWILLTWGLVLRALALQATPLPGPSGRGQQP
ncbi:MAG: hypothetical protein AAFU79_05260 [Myxococcota bacterium]